MKYEHFHSDIEGSRRKLYEFLGVDGDSAAEVPDALRPGFTDERPNEFNRKGQVGDWQNYVTDEVKAWIKDEAGEELIRQGFTDSMDW